MLVYINAKDFKTTGQRILVEATLVRKFDTTFLVRLPDGNVILRKFNRDVPQEESAQKNV